MRLIQADLMKASIKDSLEEAQAYSVQYAKELENIENSFKDNISKNIKDFVKAEIKDIEF